LILPNLIPSEGPIDFKASYDNHTNMLYLAFRDPATWCQTGSIELKCKNPQTAVRWLYKGLNAVFDGHGLKELWGGGNAQGIADGKVVVPMSMVLAKETLLTGDVYTIWFTGPYQPFECRQYSLEMLMLRQPTTKAAIGLVKSLERAFKNVTFPQNSPTELVLVQSEYGLTNGSASNLVESHNALAQLFITGSLGNEMAIIKQLSFLEEDLLEILRQDAEM
jgi:hypothetical protein